MNTYTVTIHHGDGLTLTIPNIYANDFTMALAFGYRAALTSPTTDLITKIEVTLHK